MVAAALAVLAVMVYQIPAVNDRLGWRVEYALIYARSVVDPIQAMPTAAPAAETSVAQVTDAPTRTPTQPATPTPVAATGTPEPSPTPTFTATPVPDKVILPAPRNEKEDLNACGPATLAMYLRFYGWEGDQFTISKEIKPIRADRNVNIEELYSYVLKNTLNLRVQYRVGGSIDYLREFIANGVPVMIEESFKLDKAFRINDDLWAGHYVLLTGYNDAMKVFTVQDSERGPNRVVTYEQVEKDWQSFNHVYMFIYPVEKEPDIQAMLGSDWNADQNRQNALDAAKKETETNPKNGYAWFNLGTNLVYFERYTEAVQAYDKAREAGLPQRMLRYQFGPFIAYFHSGRTEDLLTLTDYALEVTDNSEEAQLWRGWGLYRQGKRAEAVESFQKALEDRPGYPDALYALDYVSKN